MRLIVRGGEVDKWPALWRPEGTGFSDELGAQRLRKSRGTEESVSVNVPVFGKRRSVRSLGNMELNCRRHRQGWHRECRRDPRLTAVWFRFRLPTAEQIVDCHDRIGGGINKWCSGISATGLVGSESDAS